MTGIEFAGFIFGVVGVWLTIRENVWCFPVGLANVIISMFLFMEQHLYSDSIQQGVYIILLSYGWYNWIHPKNEKTLLVSKTGILEGILIAFSSIIIAISMGSFFHYFTDADVPYIDASATALSFAAQYLIARKKIENWLVWMFVNVMYVGIYLYKDLYLYAILFLIYFILSITGYLKWKKVMNYEQ